MGEPTHIQWVEHETKTLRIKKLVDKARVPKQMTSGSAGMDLYSCEQFKLQRYAPYNVSAISTGIAVSIPEGYEGQIRPRSSLAARHQVTVLNSPGTLDSDYRGEVKVLLINHGYQAFIVEPGMRIAQLVICPVLSPRQLDIEVVDELDETRRGSGGFGSTGV